MAEQTTATGQKEPKTEDSKKWGLDTFVYCGSHLRPHRTDWCTVGLDMKVDLGTDDEKQAYRKCERLGLHIWKG